jgi:alkylation response protein AidB-like acyl-CoA dehydrogenase
MSTLQAFRSEIRAWLDGNCPRSMRAHADDGDVFDGTSLAGGSKEPVRNPEAKLWLDRCAARGFTVPMWPKAYGGAGLDLPSYMVLLEEMGRIGARPPLVGMGLAMIGPTLLEFGTEEQKLRHLPKIASGEIRWCQGYSEPGSGSDLASLQTRAEDMGDHFVINGSKIWTTLAQYGDWMFCLVRTDTKAPKHDGISFVLFPMDQPGVTVRPLTLISGNNHFCQCFFDNAIARKEDLVGQLNKGWTVGKRLLQHERSGIVQLAGQATAKSDPKALAAVARAQVGDVDGRIAEPALRSEITQFEMNERALRLTQRRTVEESEGGRTPGPATSMFKLYEANLRKQRQELLVGMRGFGGIGWEGDAFAAEALTDTRVWLQSKASSIAGGSNEVQLNIIAKRVLGLPD